VSARLSLRDYRTKQSRAAGGSRGGTN